MGESVHDKFVQVFQTYVENSSNESEDVTSTDGSILTGSNSGLDENPNGGQSQSRPWGSRSQA